MKTSVSQPEWDELTAVPTRTKAGTLRDRAYTIIQQKPWLSALLIGMILSVITVGTIASAQSRARPAVSPGAPTNSAVVAPTSLAAVASLNDRASAAPRSTQSTIATPSEGVVNINTASEEELQRLPGIGPSRATAIVALRTRVQRFRGTDDLIRIRGIGRVSFRRLRPYLTLTGETTLLSRPGRARPAESNDSVQ